MALLIPEYLQTKKYSALRVRQLLMNLPIQAGVIGATDLKVSQRSTGANKTVDIAIGDGWVKGSFTARQGLYHVYNDAVVNLTVPDNASGNPRVDQVIAKVNDTTDGGGIADSAEFQLLQGTPTAGATLDNAAGTTSRAALPVSALRIAEFVTASGFTSITDGIIRDRRPWARGAHVAITHANTTDLTFSQTTFGSVWTWASPRIECTGNPIRISVSCTVLNSNTTGYAQFAPAVDGVADALLQRWFWSLSTGQIATPFFSWVVTPSAGSHLFDVFARMTGGNAIVYRSSNGLPQLMIEEILRPSASNG